MRSYIKAAGASAALYLVQFVILPLLAPRYFPRSNEAYLLFTISVVTAAGMAVWAGKCEIRHLLAADVLYFLLVLAYPAGGAYGIGLRGVQLDGIRVVFTRAAVPLGAAAAALLLLAAQLVAWLFAKTVGTIGKSKQA